MNYPKKVSALQIVVVYCSLVIAFNTCSPVIGSGEHDEDTNIAFNLPDLIVKHKTSRGEYQLQAYKSTGNDQIIRDLRASTTPPPIIAQLQWVNQ